MHKNMNKNLWVRLLLSAVAMLLVAAACGNSEGQGACDQGECIAAADGTVLRIKSYGGSGTAVLLAHDLDGSQGEWAEFAETLSSRGYTVMTFDFRGHGKSPGQRDAALAESDLASALVHMREQLRAPKVLLVGAGMGGIAALRVSARESVSAVATVSAPATLRGLSAADAVPLITAPKLFLAGEGAAADAGAARNLSSLAKDPKDLLLVPGNAHGTSLLNNTQARDRLLQFLDKYK